MEDEAEIDSGATRSDDIHPSELQLLISHGRSSDAQAVIVGEPNPTLEIVVDGSDLLHGGVGRDGLELSIMFEKNNEEEGPQSELASQLDGVEVRVRLDNTNTVGVEVISSDHGNHAIIHPEDLQLAIEGPHIDAWVGDADTHILPAPNLDDQIATNDVLMENSAHTLPALSSGSGFPEKDDVKESCSNGDENQSNEKKRAREVSMIDNDRCLKSRTEEDYKTEELEKIGSSTMDTKKHTKPVNFCSAGIPVANALCAKLSRTSSGIFLDDRDLKSENICEAVSTTIGVENFVTDDVQSKEAYNGLGMNDNTIGKESREKSLDASIEGSACDKDGTMEDKGGRKCPRKRRKIAMLLAYCGAGYQGMQKNPGALTIEGELEQALLKAGAMPENFDGNPRKVDWMRAARTDKGVSAVGQVVSGLFYVDPSGFVERVNAHLPQQIRLLGFKRVTPTFSAKKFCDRRRYEYVIPTFALDPSCHRDREAVLASEGLEGALSKCLECSERGRKIPVRKASDKLLANKVETSAGKLSDEQNLSANGTSNEIGLSFNSKQSHEESIVLELRSSTTTGSASSAWAMENEDTKKSFLDDVAEPKKKSFHIEETDRRKLNCLLNQYIGTHNFHNFTSRVKAEDPSAKRYIVSFEAGDVFTVGNMDFIRCTVVGQSFMLHQIRKMIGLVIAIFRGCAPESLLETALRRDTNIAIPTAPELGLFLDECMYPAYNQKWCSTHEEVSQKGYELEISSFKHKVIYEHIAATEDKEGQMALFLHSLNDRNYADFATAREAEKQLARGTSKSPLDQHL